MTSFSLVGGKQRSVTMSKNTICLWYDHDAEEAARFYARTFSDSTVGAVRRAPS
jgi:predicted 3-demethylubiquinone-9 3-methyltransferase (glyoxalase superfamily)